MDREWARNGLGWDGNGPGMGREWAGNGPGMGWDGTEMDREWARNGLGWDGNGPGMGWEWARNGLGMGREWDGNGPGMSQERAGNGLRMECVRITCTLTYQIVKVLVFLSLFFLAERTSSLPAVIARVDYNQSEPLTYRPPPPWQ